VARPLNTTHYIIRGGAGCQAPPIGSALSSLSFRDLKTKSLDDVEQKDRGFFFFHRELSISV